VSYADGVRTAAAIFVVASVFPLMAACKGRVTANRGEGTPFQPNSPSAKGEPKQGFRDGDLIFHESTSRQSEMVRALTRSRWTHMGVVFNGPSGAVVLEAVSPVRWTSVDKWIARGKDRLFVVKRLRDAESRLDPATLAKMRTLGSSWLGRPYDLRFRWDDEALYCSELAHKLYARAANVRLGKVELASEMNLSDDRVQRALQRRFAGSHFDPAEPVVTPDSIFNDQQLVEVNP
jgi:hypothetical protein